MSRPIQANPKRQGEAAKWHRDVFARYGNKCWFCGGHATDAMHIIRRSFLGPLRYKIIENGRPGCRPCHNKKPNQRDFPIADQREAIIAHNLITKEPLHVP
jgi:5-methylcytosine-specific restriction endonuclease McrA